MGRGSPGTVMALATPGLHARSVLGVERELALAPERRIARASP